MKEKVLKMNLDMLENVSGGVMTEKTELRVDEIVGSLKRRFDKKADVLTYVRDNYSSMFGSFKGLKKAELIDYINKNWDLL